MGRKGVPVSSHVNLGVLTGALTPFSSLPAWVLPSAAQSPLRAPTHTQPRELRKIGRKKIILTWVSDSKLAAAAALGLVGGCELWLRLFLPFHLLFLPYPAPLLQHLMGLHSGHPRDFLLCSAPADRRWQKHREPQFLCQICRKITKTSKNDGGGRKHRSTPRTHSVELLQSSMSFRNWTKHLQEVSSLQRACRVSPGGCASGQ